MVIYKGSPLTPRVGLELSDFRADEAVDFNQPPGLSMALTFLGCLVSKLLWFWWWWGRDTSKKVERGAFASQHQKIFAKELGLVINPTCTPFLKV